MLAITLIGVVLYIGSSTAETDEAVLKRLEANEGLVRTLLTEVEHLKVQERLVLTLQTEVEHLKSQDKLQRRQIANLETKLRYQQQRSAKYERLLRELLTQPKPDYKVKTESTIRAQHDNTSKATSKQTLVRDMPTRKRRVENEIPVAFFATMNNHLHHAGVRQPIVFKNVVINIGNAYNNHLGSFIAPRTGVYVFSTTMVAYVHNSAHAQIVKNGIALSNLFVSGTEAGWDTSSQTIVLHLQKGDDVYIQNRDLDNSFNGGNYSTFAGFLLQEDLSSPSIVG